MTVIVSRAPASSKKKWVATFQDDGRKVMFGAAGYEDYTIHKNPERMRLYVQRHQRHENWDDKYSAGFWSRWLLWSEPSLSRARQLVEQKLKEKVIVRP